ncbi:MAG: hypothetical protein A4E56_01905 [Pelotomaculum sp. PtaU1.Bin065]|nr:MAG: hypothetical protein A4E56_01905 [Pelotomaculum sp. PtaU1.Bin065]
MIRKIKNIIDEAHFKDVIMFLEEHPEKIMKISLRNIGKKRMVYLYKLSKAFIMDEDYRKKTVRLTLYEKTREELFKYFGLPFFDMFL